MNTKTKIIHLVILYVVSLFFIENIHAAWYGNYNLPKWAAGATNCYQDGDTDIVWPTIAQWTGPAGDWWFQYANWQTQVLSDNGWSITCQFWDATNPTGSNLEYAPPVASWGWQNTTSITITWNANDTGGSWLRDYDIRVYRIAGAQGTPVVLFQTLSNVTAGPGPLYTYNYTWLDGYAYSFEVCPRDNALNTCTTWISNSSGNGIVRIDTTPPSASDLDDTSDQDVLATDNQNLNLSFNDAAAPVKVWYRVENNNNPALYDSFVTPDPYSFAYPYIADVSNVDIDRGPNGWREVTILVDQICDQAGNCISIPVPLKTFTHFVYANPNFNPSNTQDTSEFDSAVADGQPRNLTQTIRDGYGNALIKATGINRNISMNLSGISNSMFLNQYTRLGTTSVYVTAPNNAVDQALSFTPTQAFANYVESSDGTYPLTIKVYTPTENSYASGDPISDPGAEFWFTTNLVINDDLIGQTANMTFSQSYDAPVGSNQPSEHYFSPLYTTDITGDLRVGWFIEGTEQQSYITVTDNNMAVTPGSIGLQLEFSGANVWSFDLYGWSVSNSTTTITSIRADMVANPWNSDTDLFTKLEQKPNIAVATGSNLYLSTHFAYQLDWKNVLYNSDIIGKPWYYSSIVTTIGNQVWVKIIGPIASNAIRSIVAGQFADSTSIFSWLTRSVVRNNVTKSVALAIRNMKYAPVPSMVSNLKSFAPWASAQWWVVEKWAGASIMVIEKSGWDITLSLASWISGKRTLVIKWANLYITNDMYYADSKSILGVVVEKDKNGNGWNLYIDPSITNIVWTYVIDWSIMSYDGSNEIGVGNIGILKNQLHSYWSLVSENTLGGSRMNPIQCPSLLNAPCATTSEAQKYDLNYLRRYYIYNNQPFGWAKVIWGATCTSVLCSWFDSNLISKFTTPNNDLAKYPVIIEYNPLMRISPPIGFEESKD